MPLPPPDIITDQAVDVRVQLETLQGLLGTPTPGLCQTSSRFDAVTRVGYAARADTHLRTFLRLSAGEDLGSPTDWIRRSSDLNSEQKEKVAALFTTYGQTLCLAGSLEEGIQWQGYADALRGNSSQQALSSAPSLVRVTLTIKASPSESEATSFWDGLEVQLIPPASPGGPPETVHVAARANDWLKESRRSWPWTVADLGGPPDQGRTVTLYLTPGAYGLDFRTTATSPENPQLGTSLATTAPPAFHTARNTWLCEASLLGGWSCRPSGSLSTSTPKPEEKTSTSP